jgi:hypothetical protein
MSSTTLPRGTRSDCYDTPPWVVRAIAPILARELREMGRAETAIILDPAAGTGNILATLHEDLRDEHGPLYPLLLGIEIDPARAAACAAKPGVLDCHAADALERSDATSRCWGEADAIVMNPPFSLAVDFVSAAIGRRKLGALVVALLRLAFLEGLGRAVFHRGMPSDVHVLAKRPSFTGRGTDSSAYAWFVWGGARARGRWSVLTPPETRASSRAEV